MGTLGTSVNRGDPPRVAQAKLAVLKTVLSVCRSLWAPGDASIGSAALKAFERALKERELQFASARSRRGCVLLTLHMILEMRFREGDLSAAR